MKLNVDSGSEDEDEVKKSKRMKEMSYRH